MKARRNLQLQSNHLNLTPLLKRKKLPLFPNQNQNQNQEPEPELQLPANSYYAVVTWPEGLSLRAEPSVDAERVGGIEYNSKIAILEDSNDGKWQRVMLPWNQQEGWVKGGNTKRAL